jgi:hypothetical protein
MYNFGHTGYMEYEPILHMGTDKIYIPLAFHGEVPL